MLSHSIYDSTFNCLNKHNLIHVPDDVQNSNCSLSEISAFPFESYLGSINAVLRSPTNIVAQYCRRLEEKNTFLKKEIIIQSEIQILVKKKEEIRKIKYNGLTLSIKSPDNTVLLKNGNVVVISAFEYNNNNVRNIKVKIYLTKESVFKYPYDSIDLNIFEVNKLSDSVICAPLKNVSRKLVKLEMNFSSSEELRIFTVPLLH